MRGLPLWNRVLLVIRHEPAWAPETVAARGGGATGARNALAAVAARTVARGGARRASRLRPLGAAEVEPAAARAGRSGTGRRRGRARSLTTATSVHTALSVPLHDADTVGAVLRAAAELDVDRSVLSVAVNAIDHSTCAVVRLVVTDPETLDRAATRLTGRRAGHPAAGRPDARAGRHAPAGRRRPVARRPRQPGAHVITTDALPATRWRDPRDVPGRARAARRPGC